MEAIPTEQRAVGTAHFKVRNAGYTAANGTQLLGDVSFELCPGTFTSIIGHNGSGKSTLMKLMANQQAATEGDVLLEDKPLGSWSSRALARSLAYMMQDPGEGADYLVEELVALGRYPWHGPFGKFGRDDQAAVERALRLTGLETLRKRSVATLSGGERQRTWIAVMLAQEAKTLLLDEPISALDLAHQIDVCKLLQRLAHEEGLCVIAILHDVTLSARFCDRILALKQTKLIADGTPAELVKPEVLESIFGVPMCVLQNEEQGFPVAFAV